MGYFGSKSTCPHNSGSALMMYEVMFFDIKLYIF